MEWTERYASQPESLRYLNHVADRFDLRRDIQLASRVERAWFDEAQKRWQVGVAGGEEISAKWLVMATGCLSRPNTPQVPGVDNGPLDPEVQRRVKADYAGFRARCSAQFAAADFAVNEQGALFMPYSGGFPDYSKRCKEVAAAGYTGFAAS